MDQRVIIRGVCVYRDECSDDGCGGVAVIAGVVPQGHVNMLRGTKAWGVDEFVTLCTYWLMKD